MVFTPHNVSDINRARAIDASPKATLSTANVAHSMKAASSSRAAGAPLSSLPSPSASQWAYTTASSSSSSSSYNHPSSFSKRPSMNASRRRSAALSVDEADLDFGLESDHDDETEDEEVSSEAEHAVPPHARSRPTTSSSPSSATESFDMSAFYSRSLFSRSKSDAFRFASPSPPSRPQALPSTSSPRLSTSSMAAASSPPTSASSASQTRHVERQHTGPGLGLNDDARFWLLEEEEDGLASWTTYANDDAVIVVRECRW